jgi:cardiolipin synthase
MKFIWKPIFSKHDATGRRIADALRRAAVRGVITHLLIDGFGSIDLPQTIIDDLEAAGVMVLKFRPKTSPWTLRRRRLRRLHRKIVVIDRKIAFVGGINIVDDMGAANQTSPRYDYAVSVEGPLVEDIHDSASHVWSRVAWSRMRDHWNRDVGGHSSSIEPKGACVQLFWCGTTSAIAAISKTPICGRLNRRNSKSLLQTPTSFPG